MKTKNLTDQFREYLKDQKISILEELLAAAGTDLLAEQFVQLHLRGNLEDINKLLAIVDNINPLEFVAIIETRAQNEMALDLDYHKMRSDIRRIVNNN